MPVLLLVSVRIAHSGNLLGRGVGPLHERRRLRFLLACLLRVRDDRGRFRSSDRFGLGRDGVGARHGQRSEEVVFRVRAGHRGGCAGGRSGREAEAGTGEAQA